MRKRLFSLRKASLLEIEALTMSKGLLFFVSGDSFWKPDAFLLAADLLSSSSKLKHFQYWTPRQFYLQLHLLDFGLTKFYFLYPQHAMVDWPNWRKHSNLYCLISSLYFFCLYYFQLAFPSHRSNYIFVSFYLKNSSPCPEDIFFNYTSKFSFIFLF